MPSFNAECTVGPPTWHVCCRNFWLGLETPQLERKCGILRRNKSRCVCFYLADSLSYGCLETAAYVFGIIVYLSVTIPSLRAIAEPTKEEIYNDQVMALRVLSAGNIIIIGSLLLILALQVRGLIGKHSWIIHSLWLQAGQEWARRQEANALATSGMKEKEVAAVEKKENWISLAHFGHPTLLPQQSSILPHWPNTI